MLLKSKSFDKLFKKENLIILLEQSLSYLKTQYEENKKETKEEYIECVVTTLSIAELSSKMFIKTYCETDEIIEDGFYSEYIDDALVSFNKMLNESNILKEKELESLGYILFGDSYEDISLHAAHNDFDGAIDLFLNISLI